MMPEESSTPAPGDMTTMHEGSQTHAPLSTGVPPVEPQAAVSEAPNGAVAAAFLSAAIGLFVLGIVQFATTLNDAFADRVFALGKAWIPNAQGIGPYSGKETLMVVAWAASWVILHVSLQRRRLDLKPWFGTALVFVFLAAILVWPPVWHLFE
jgi:hypothetical protein